MCASHSWIRQKKILLVDDDALVRKSLQTILESKGFQVVGLAQNGEEALLLYQKVKPHVVLMDIRMGGKDGIWGTEQILKKDPEAKILLLTTFKEEEYIKKALAMGARGYILKQNYGELAHSIEAVLTGCIVLDQEVMDMAFKKEAGPAKDVGYLTEREQELLAMVAEGLNNKEIAEKLFLSEGTVRNYISKLLEKLELRDRTQLAIFYYKGKQ